MMNAIFIERPSVRPPTPYSRWTLAAFHIIHICFRRSLTKCGTIGPKADKLLPNQNMQQMILDSFVSGPCVSQWRDISDEKWIDRSDWIL
ncbi:hypothetical protein TNCT_376951 [Trichonephila clavata]|uniref:Uncharacterized protein n=1 Tax=Trichonephila clavata TaxID=2740835 RepID=A0A8X6LEI8_TRICU|nr:hypothetical protein TNCT_376951 [Trichonephila clavata]